MATNYSDARLGLRMRAFSVPLTADDVDTAGTLVNAYINLPRKSKIVGFGVQSADSAVVLATNDGFELRTGAGAKLATFVADADYTLAAGAATQQAPETATTIAQNTPMACCVASDAGVSGSVYYFVDYQEVFDA